MEKISLQPSIIFFSLLFISVNFIKSIFEIFIKYCALVIKYTVQKEILSDLLRTFLYTQFNFFTNKSQGKFLNTFNREITVVGDTLGHLTMQLAQTIQLFIYLVVPLMIDPIMTFSALAIAIVLSIPFLFLKQRSYFLGKANTETANKNMSVISEIFSGLRVIIANSKQEKMINLHKNVFTQHVNATIKSQILAQSIQSIYYPIGIAAAICSMGISVYLGMKLSDTAIVLWSLFRAIPILGTLIRTNINISNFIPSYEQLEILKDRANQSSIDNGEVKLVNFKDKIIFKDVEFYYSSNKPIFNKLDIQIFSNKLNAIIGKSGSGKSTLLDLLMRMQIPTKGNIFIDGIDLQDLDINSYRNIIGYVPQEPFLFNGTIKDNLLWAAENKTDKEILEACELANAKSFIINTTDSLETFIGDNGIMLSGGQKQRISIARSLLRKPQILILDEPTSALDNETEIAIKETINNLKNKLTIIVVTHRLGLIEKANNIINIDKLNNQVI